MTRNRQLTSLVRLFLLALLTVVLAPHVLHGRAASPAPPLPPPTGSLVYVSTEAQLQTAVRQLASNTTIILAPGTYLLTSTLYVNGMFTNVAIRGGTDNRDDVVLLGPGMANATYGNVPYGIWTGGNVEGLTIANLTIRDIYYHAIMFNAGTESPRVYNVHLLDIGSQLIESSPNGAGGGVDNGIVEYSVIEYTTTAKDANTNGIDVHTGANWIIRHNLFRNIVAPAGELAGPAVRMWNASSNTLTEGNTFLDCAREIAYGFVNAASGFDHDGGIIRNNFIYRSGARSGDVAISIADSPNTQVLNNTIYLSGTYATPIEYRFAGTTGVLLANNLLDGFPWARDGATGSERNNLSGATTDMFVNAAAGDLHLAATATVAIDHGVPLANVTDDWDGQSRPAGAAQDIGADEFVADSSTPNASTAPATSAAGAVLTPTSIAPMVVTPVASSIWDASATPSQFALSDTAAVELGVRFRADVDGSITGIRFYKGATNTGTHVGKLWTDTGTRLAAATFSSETASGWQQVTFSSPVAITANTTYVASYHTTVGQYAFDLSYFATAGVDNAPLHALADGVGGVNGAFRYGAGFPTQTFQSSNYWVDVVFSASDTIAPTVAVTTPATGATVSGSAVTVSATASDNIGVVGVQLKMDDANLGAENTAPAATYQLQLSPQDTSLNINATNYSAQPLLMAYTWPDYQVANAILMKFDLSTLPAGATVQQAVMSLALVQSDATADATYTMAALKLIGKNPVIAAATGYTADGTTPWTPNGCCFGGVPLAQADISAPYASVAVDKAPGFKTWNITTMVQEWLGSPASNFGLVLNSDATRAQDRFRTFASTKNADATLWPVLLITYSLPATTTWDTTMAANGPHTLTAVARDAAGNTTTSTAVTVTVTNADTTAPTVSITTPAPGATVSGSAVTVSATAADNVGVVGVQFKLDGANLGAEDTATAYTRSWNSTTTANGPHTLTAVARDAAGNTTTATAVTITVSNAVTPVAIDAVVWGDQQLTAATVTTAAFSTNQGNELLLAFIAVDGMTTTTVTGVAGGGLTWQLVRRTNVQHGTSEIWRAFAAAALTNAVATATVSPASPSTITVVSFSGVDPSGTNGAGAVGATGSGNASPGAPTALLTTTRDNAWVFGVGNDQDFATARTLGPNQTMVHEFLPQVGDTFWVQRTTAPAASAGTSVTINDVAPSGDRYNLSIVEILPFVTDTTVPTVAITAPTPGATVSGSAVTVSATAADNVGVVGVQFKLDGANLGAEDTTTAYTRSWNSTTTANGPHTLTATARDAAGNTTTATVVTVTVTNADTTAPTVSITTPTPGATVSGSAVTVSATAADNVGVVGVQFKLDGANLGVEDTATAYTLSWNSTTTANGPHTLTATARDAAGNTTTSMAVTVTVTNADTTAPTVSITAPATGATVSGSAVTVSATAADNVGVVGVQFKLDGANLGAEDTATAYTRSWNSTTTANGPHTLTAVARDAAGNTTTATAVTITVSNAVTPVAIDAVVWGDQQLTAATVTTAAFSTNQGNELLLAFIAVDGMTTTTVTGVAGGGLTWQLVRRTNVQHGTSEIWRAFAAAALTNAVATATVSPASPSTITVVSFSGVDPSGTNGAGAVGATGSGNASPGAPTALLTTTRDNAWVFGVGNDQDFATARTLGPNQTMVHEFLPQVGDTFWVQRTTAPAASAGTSVTINDVAPSGDRYNLSIVEILPFVTDTTVPTVAITAPTPGATVSGSAVTVSATAADNVGVVGVQFKLDGANLGAEDTTTAYTLSWNSTTTANGPHTLTATARDAAGNTTTATVVTVTVNNAADTTAPTVSITAPATGATVSGAVTVSATAADNVGVVGVQFKLDGANLGVEDTATAYTLSWNSTTTANGPHTLTAVARDAAGNTTTATAVTITVSNAVTPVAIDAVVWGDQQLTAATVTTAAFSTNQGNELLLAFIAVDGMTTTTVTGVAGGGLTWQLVRRTNVQHGTSEIWRAFAAAALTNAVATATVSPASPSTITVVSFSGVDPSGTNGAGAVGATGSGNASPGAPTALLTTTRDNAWVFGVGNDQDFATARTLGPNQTMVHEFLPQVGDTFWVQRTTAPAASAGTSVTINDVAPSGDRYNLSIVEILPFVTDTTVPTVAITAPTPGATVSGSAVTVSATAADNVGVVGVQFKLDGANLGAEDTATAYTLSWNSTTTTNGPHTLTATARDAAGNTTTATVVTVTVNNAADTTAPTVSITAPATGATVSGSAVTVSATAADNVGVVGVQFKLDGANLGAEDTATAYTRSWNSTTTANGPHTLTATARDAAGNTTTSMAVTVTVTNADTTAPTVSITAPATGATVSGSAVTVSATAADNVGVVGVQFKLDGANLGAEDAATAYTLSWNSTTTANGPHTLTAVARDAAGNTTTSTAVTVTVTNADTTAPTVSITTPAPGATVSGSAVTVSATAADNVGVVGVQFKLDGANLGAEDTATAYTRSWNSTTTANGPHTLTAVARDAAGNTTTATAVTITVSNAVTPVAIDAVVWGDQQLTAATVTTAAFSTNQGNELLLAFIAVDGMTTTTVTGVAGGGLTWQLVRRTNVQHGTSEIWRAFAAAALTNAVATATVSPASPSTITVVSFSGVDPSGTNGAGAVGATGSGNASPGAPTALLTTTRDNAWVFGVGNDQDFATARTLGPNQTMVHEFLPQVGDTFWVQRTTAPAASAGTSVTINDVAPSGDRYNLSIVEILPFVTDTTVPTVAITAPTPGATVSGSAVTVSATAADNVGVVGVQFKLDGANLGAEDTTTAYTLSWNSTTTANGPHTLTATARDAAGNTTTATVVTVTVNNAADTTAPTVSITAPATGVTVSGAVTVSATAADNVGVVGVQFKLDGANLGAEDTATAYTLSWNSTTTANGPHTLTATARDAAGNTAISAAVTVTVSNTVSTPPTTVDFQASADHNNGVTSYLLDVFANGADPNTATPVTSSDLAKPTPDGVGDITVDRTSFFGGMLHGTYVMTVSAMGPTGRGRSLPVTVTW